MVTAHFRQEHDTHTETGKSVYKALTLHGKQLLLNVINREATKVLYSSVHSHSMNTAPINSATRSSSDPYSYSYLTI